MTDEADVTELKRACEESGISFYIAFLYTVARVVNSREEFRLTAVDMRGEEYMMPAVWNRVDVSHNVFHEESETYTSIFTAWREDFAEFYANAAEDIERGRRLSVMSVPCAENVFEASCIPWRHFSSVGLDGAIPPLFPIIVWGKLKKTPGAVTLPLSISVHHASADGFHIARFFEDVERVARETACCVMELSEEKLMKIIPRKV